MVANNLFWLLYISHRLYTLYRYNRKVDHYHTPFTISVLLNLEDIKHVKVNSPLFYGHCEVLIDGQYSIPFE